MEKTQARDFLSDGGEERDEMMKRIEGRQRRRVGDEGRREKKDGGREREKKGGPPSSSVN